MHAALLSFVDVYYAGGEAPQERPSDCGGPVVESKAVEELKRRDVAVRAHENAHAAAGE